LKPQGLLKQTEEKRKAKRGSKERKAKKVFNFKEPCEREALSHPLNKGLSSSLPSLKLQSSGEFRFVKQFFFFANRGPRRKKPSLNQLIRAQLAARAQDLSDGAVLPPAGRSPKPPAQLHEPEQDLAPVATNQDDGAKEPPELARV